MSIIINISIVPYLIVGSYCTMKHAYESEQGFKISLSQCLGSLAGKYWMNEQSYRLQYMFIYKGLIIIIIIISVKTLLFKALKYFEISLEYLSVMLHFRGFLLVNKEFVCCLNCVVNSSGIWVLQGSWFFVQNVVLQR